MNGMIPGIVRRWRLAQRELSARHGVLTKSTKVHRMSAFAFAGSRFAGQRRRVGAAIGRRPGGTV